MKPLKLVISGIGPYGGKMPEIDFQKLNMGQPLLIAGETGAGKTMLFDAICFALFDTVSGSYRSTENLRSEYAAPDTESYVDFSFSHQGRNYRIYRQPTYSRPAKRKSGGTVTMVQVKEKAVLYQEGETPIEGIKAVNNALLELLHVDEKQFKQLAMIAQGEFWGLLNAKTEERTGILRHIFRTEGYKSLEMQLREKRGKTAQERDRLENSLIQYFNGAEAEAGTDLADNLQALQEKQQGGFHGGEAVLQLLENIILADEEGAKAEQAKLQELEKAGEVLQRDFSLADNHSHNFQRYNELQNDIGALQKKAAAKAQQQQAQTEDKEKLAEKIARLQQEQDKLKDAPVNLVRCQQSLQNLQGMLDRIQNLQQQGFAQYRKAKKHLEQQQVALQQAQADHEKAWQAMNRGENQLELNRAGLLAQNLQEGQPCPVCGSRQHPQLALLPAQAVTEVQVKKLKDTEKKAADARTKAAAGAAGAKGELDTLTQQLDRYMRECLADPAWREFLAQSGRVPAEPPAQASLRTLFEMVKVQQQKITVKAGELYTEMQTLDGQAKQLERLQKELARAQNEETKVLEQKQLALQKNMEKLQTELAAKEGQSQQLFRLISQSGRNSQEAEAYKQSLQQKLQENKKLVAECRSRLGRLDHRRENNAACREKINCLLPELARLQHEAAIYSRLFNMVSGQTGNGKLTLEQYVQAAGFDRIIRAANRRLGPMSDGRYELHRQDRALGNRSHTYLDLEALDNYTGHSRPVRNLSGGESFMASLSLALGLSDRLSSELGGISMDALFIDEGFGTLDKKSIEKAMEILLKLSDSNKLVAVISHREELREAISQQIRIVKTRRGSTMEMV